VSSHQWLLQGFNPDGKFELPHNIFVHAMQEQDQMKKKRVAEER
jgi:hypothetical protein